jgi:hypothetical protein
MTQTLKLFNGTARKISIFSKEDVAEVQSSNRNLILKEGAIPLLEIETDSILNAKIETKPAPGLESNIPLVGGVTFSSVDPLPKGYDLYVVSN